MLNGLNEFCVKFYGPKGSKYFFDFHVKMLFRKWEEILQFMLNMNYQSE